MSAIVLARRLVFVVALASAACQLGVHVPTPPECRSDFDCPLDSVCATGACVRVPSSGTFDLMLTPPNDSPYPKQQIVGVSVNEGTSAIGDLALRPAAILGGRIVLSDGSTQSGLQARVEANRAGEIAGTLLHASVSTVAANDGSWRYQLALWPGTYDVNVFPQDPTLPPIIAFPRVDATASGTHDFTLPQPDSLPRLTGDVVRVAGARIGVVGAQVQAFSAAGVALSAPVRSGDLGRFALRVLPSSGPVTVRVSRASDGPRLPTVERVIAAALADYDLGAIVMGSFEPPLPVYGTIRGKAADGSAVPIAGAYVTISGPAGAGLWSEHATSDDGGNFQVEMPPGRYDIEIRPPVDGDYAISTGVLLVPEVAPAAWTLDRKSALWGTLVGPDGRPVSGARIEATRRGAVGSESTWNYLRTTSTDANGAYSVRLDPGVYDLSFIPEGQPLARADLTGVTMRGDNQRLDQSLPPSVVLTGVLRDPSGGPLPNVAVEVFEHGASSTARLLGADVTSSAGAYRVIIPAR